MEHVMFKYQDVIDGLKSLPSAEGNPGELSHCQLLDFQAKKLGFQSYHHLRETLKQLPTDAFAALSLGLMRRICEKKLPSRQDCFYFEFVPLPKGLGYYSHWIGWDKSGDEVRVPRPLQGMESVKGMRKAADFPVYVVESEKELEAWQRVWRSTAYVPEDLARERFAKYFDKEQFVADPPPIDLVRIKARSGRYNNNFACDDEG